MIGHIILRLTIWFLLTASFSAANIIIGIIVALLLPRSAASPERLKDLLGALVKIVAAIPRAYVEAFELIIRPHSREEVFMNKTLKLLVVLVALIAFGVASVAVAAEFYVVKGAGGALSVVDKKPADAKSIVKGPFKTMKEAQAAAAPKAAGSAKKPPKLPDEGC